MKVTKTENAHCPNCGALNDAATEVGGSDAVPQDDDVCICATCGLIGMYVVTDGDLTVRFATDAELEELRKMPSMERAFEVQAFIRGER